MKLLFIVTYLFNHGGDSNHAFAIADELRIRGHEVFFFGMWHEDNLPGFIGPLAPRIDYKELLSSNSASAYIKALSSIYSYPARKAAKEFIDKYGPFDLAHVHSVHHQLTMSVLDILKYNSIPFVWTLHDYKLVCPNTTLYDETAECICPYPGEKIPICVAKRRCKKKSLPASVLAAIESWFIYHRKYYELPECYISPSSFLQNIIHKIGVTSKPIHIVPNFSPHKIDEEILPPGDNTLFVGRLENVKGIELLIKAYSGVYSNKNGKLVIVGTGSAEKELKRLASELLPHDCYLFTGRINSISELIECFRQARCMVLPSIWYENMPLVILEAYSHARPVIATNLGGMPEIVINKKTGILFEVGSVTELTEAINFYNSDFEVARKHGLAGWNIVQNELTKNCYMEKIEEIYKSVCHV